jgi:carbonic anhydrase
MTQASKTTRFKLAACGLLAVAAFGVRAGDQPAHHAHWDYVGKHGTKAWGNLEPDYALCKLGKNQSPINIQDKQAKKTALPALAFHYVPETGEVVNNGHTIQVNVAAGSSIGLDDGEYQLVQFHFHTPSEEKINGKPFPMEAHFVHKNEAGKLAVVAVLLKEGKENATLKEVFENMPAKPETTQPLKNPIQLADLLPAQQGYYHYMGSLTTPPCSEDVSWQVLKQPVEISKAQLKAFHKLYRMNARPVQALNGRKLQKS